MFLIYSLGGVVLDYTVSAYKGIAVFQPVINGVGGNLAAVQASRLSTWLHRRGRPGDPIPDEGGVRHSKVCINPIASFCTTSIHAKTSRVLLLLVIIKYFNIQLEQVITFQFSGFTGSCHLHIGYLLPSSWTYKFDTRIFLYLFIRRLFTSNLLK